MRDRYAYVTLIVTGILVRIPFLKVFDLVSYDGTYYIKLATSILRGAYRASGFPIGYPVFIAFFIPIVRDGVRAAQAVSFLAGIGSLLVFYALCKQYLKRSYALAAGLLFAITPLFIRISTMTLSESIYIFWVLLGFLLFAKRRDFFSGLCIGMSAITRPESIGILVVLGALRFRKPKRLLLILAGFMILYSANATVQSVGAGRVVVLPKSALFGTSAENWEVREKTIDFPSKEKVLKQLGIEQKETSIASDYFKRLPRELFLLVRHASLFVFLLALYGIYRKRLFLLALFVPFLVFPFFTFRSEARFILPYIPGLILYAMVGLQSIEKRRIFILFTVLLSLFIVLSLIINIDQLVKPVSGGQQWAKRIGRSFKAQVLPGDRIADRKPFFPFYAGGEYFEIPFAPIDITLEYLAGNDVKYLALNPYTIHTMRSQLIPLLYDPIFINSELRYSQILFQQEVVIYKKEMDSDPLKRRSLKQQQEGLIFGPAWSPDGEKIAYRLIDPSGEGGGIYSVSPLGGGERRIIEGTNIEDAIAWAPDSKRIAFAADYDGNTDIYVHDTADSSGKLERITSHVGADISPSWSRGGKEIVFCSYRTGNNDIWTKNLETGELTQVTSSGGCSYPSFSPDGGRIAWIREGEGLFFFDRGTRTITSAEAPKRANQVPAWSPNGRYIAVTANDWGKTDVYLLTADGYDAVLLTKTIRKERQPAWSPDGRSIATVTSFEGVTELWVLTGIEAYENRLIELANTREIKNLYNQRTSDKR